MQYSSTMEIIQTFKELFCQVFPVRLFEFESRMIEEARKIVREIFEDHEAIVLLDHYFSKLNNIIVVE